MADRQLKKADLDVAIQQLKLWTGSLFALTLAILSGVMTLFHFLR